MTEFWDVLDINRNKMNKRVPRGADTLAKGEYNLAVDVWIINSKGEHLIQKRSSDKKFFPDFWESAAAGAVIAGEDSKQGMIREVSEELGIIPDLDKTKKILEFIRRDSHVDVWLIEDNINIKSLTLQKEEVADAKWATTNEIEQLIKEEKFVPTVLTGFKEVLKIIEARNND